MRQVKGDMLLSIAVRNIKHKLTQGRLEITTQNLLKIIW